MKCEIHPEVETNIHCSNCGKPICPDCMVYTPVGIKCPDCARQRGRAVAGLRPIYYARAVAAGFAVALLGGLLLFELVRLVRFGSFLFVLFLGAAIGEVVSRAARRNTGRALQTIAGLSAGLAFLVAGYLTGVPLMTFNGWHGFVFAGFSPFRLLLAAVGIYVATMRLRD